MNVLRLSVWLYICICAFESRILPPMSIPSRQQQAARVDRSVANTTFAIGSLLKKQGENKGQSLLDEWQESIRTKFGMFDLRPKECPGSRRSRMFHCPSPYPDNLLAWECVSTEQLCNGLPECPGAEDEDPLSCLFWLAGQEELRLLRKSMAKLIESAGQNNDDVLPSRMFFRIGPH